MILASHSTVPDLVRLEPKPALVQGKSWKNKHKKKWSTYFNGEGLVLRLQEIARRFQGHRMTWPLNPNFSIITLKVWLSIFEMLVCICLSMGYKAKSHCHWRIFCAEPFNCVTVIRFCMLWLHKPEHCANRYIKFIIYISHKGNVKGHIPLKLLSQW